MIESPPCPECGCPEATTLTSPARGGWWGRDGLATCENCGVQFAFDSKGRTGATVSKREAASQRRGRLAAILRGLGRRL
jgi:uncharacterized Zn finger protein